MTDRPLLRFGFAVPGLRRGSLPRTGVPDDPPGPPGDRPDPAGPCGAAIDTCRVLELGCATGGNLLPMAETLPAAQFVGVDLSDAQIETASAKVREGSSSGTLNSAARTWATSTARRLPRPAVGQADERPDRRHLPLPSCLITSLHTACIPGWPRTRGRNCWPCAPGTWRRAGLRLSATTPFPAGASNPPSGVDAGACVGGGHDAGHCFAHNAGGDPVQGA